MINLCIIVLCTIATSVVGNTLFYNVTVFIGFLINQEHDIISVLIYCGTDKCSKINYLSKLSNLSIVPKYHFHNAATVFIVMTFSTKWKLFIIDRNGRKHGPPPQVHIHGVIYHS